MLGAGKIGLICPPSWEHGRPGDRNQMYLRSPSTGGNPAAFDNLPKEATLTQQSKASRWAFRGEIEQDAVNTAMGWGYYLVS